MPAQHPFAAVGGRACQGRSSAEKAGGAYSPEYLSGGVNFTIYQAVSILRLTPPFKYDLINQLFALLNMPVLQECNTTVQTEQAMPSGAWGRAVWIRQRIAYYAHLWDSLSSADALFLCPRGSFKTREEGRHRHGI